MGIVLVCLIGAVLMALYLLDLQMGIQDMARRRWPRPVPYWMRLLISVFCGAPFMGWIVFILSERVFYAAVFVIFILFPTEMVYLIIKRRRFKRQLRQRQLATAAGAPAEG
ncbi:MAG: hypothetical protein KGO05_13480 [Chloroflexota bacterium]|nr:hypothetical protein [Chloroflexota bacterium]